MDSDWSQIESNQPDYNADSKSNDDSQQFKMDVDSESNNLTDNVDCHHQQQADQCSQNNSPNLANDLNEKSDDLNDDQEMISDEEDSEQSPCDNKSAQDKCSVNDERSIDNSVDDVRSIRTDDKSLSMNNCSDDKEDEQKNTDDQPVSETRGQNEVEEKEDAHQDADSDKEQPTVKKTDCSPDNDETKDLNKPNCDDDDVLEGSGFPKCFEGWVIRGKTIPINKKTWNDIEIDGNDSILDCVSQVVPILLKKPNIFPDRYESDKSKDKKDSSHKKLDQKKEVKEENVKNESEDKQEEEQEKDGEKSSTESKSKKEPENNSLLSISDYYSSSVGSFLMGIGLSRCKEALHKDGMRQTQRLIRKEGERAEYLEELEKQTQLYQECKGANSIYSFEQIRCGQCNFKTESESVMDGHYSIPHLSNRKEFKCNFCPFITRDSRAIEYHFLSEHKKICKIRMPNVLYECPTCDYESNQKSKAANHMAKCAVKFAEDKVFNENTVQRTVNGENDYPGITPKPINQDDIKNYDSTMQALKPLVMNPGMQLPDLPALPRELQLQMLAVLQKQFNQQKIKLNKALSSKLANQQTNLMSNLLNSVNANALASLNMNNTNLISNLAGLGNLSNNLNLGNNLNSLNNNLNSLAKTAPQLYNMLQSGSQLLNNSKSRLSSVNQQISAAQQKPNLNGLLQNSKPSSSSGNDLNSVANAGKAGFVICEICDGYIKDLEQLRAHMNLIHKVKIHPKMLANRPPLNCQKCQWRFFTDQGLERHLLGAHGLVTSNMQDLVDSGQDSGRCTICGRVFTNKLVAHMSQVHKITLRPAHLSYKCTVCSATFNLYRLFESHVYMVHSGQKRHAQSNQASSANKKMKTVDLRVNGI